MKNHYRSIVFDLSRQRDPDPKSIQLIEFVGQLKELHANDNATDASNNQSLFVLTIFKKIKEIRLKISQGSVTVLLIITNYQKSRVEITNTQ